MAIKKRAAKKKVGKKKVARKKPVKRSVSTKHALKKTIVSLRKEAAALEKFVATLDLVAEVPITRKKAPVRRVAKKPVKKKTVKRATKKRR